MREFASLLLEQAVSAGSTRGLAWADVFIKSGATRAVSLLADGSVNWTRTAEGGIALQALAGDGDDFWHRPHRSPVSLLDVQPHHLP